MAKRKRYNPEEIEVVAFVNGTEWVDTYWADEVLVAQRFPEDGSGIIQLRKGRDEHGPVKTAQYACIARIIRRPGKRKKWKKH